jgi:hypothetical protein
MLAAFAQVLKSGPSQSSASTMAFCSPFSGETDYEQDEKGLADFARVWCGNRRCRTVAISGGVADFLIGRDALAYVISLNWAASRFRRLQKLRRFRMKSSARSWRGARRKKPRWFDQRGFLEEQKD